MFRLVYLTFFNEFRGTAETRSHIHESPWTITLPLVILCVFAVVGGLIGLPHVFHVGHWLSAYLNPVTMSSVHLLHQGGGISNSVEIGLMSFAGLAAIATILYARRKYVQQKNMPLDESSLTGFAKLIYNKFYVDELYENLIAAPLFRISEWFADRLDRKLIDRMVTDTASFTQTCGRALRLIQTGNTGIYVFAMVMGIVLLFLIRMLI
jgi:NADH-quinone oxidoreductase subunit L